MSDERQESSLGSAIEGLSRELSGLVRGEVAAARQEITTNLSRLGAGVGSLLSAAALAFYGTVFLLLTVMLALALALVVSAWLAALLVGAMLLIVTAAVVFAARKRLKQVRFVPAEALDHLRRDLTTIQTAAGRIKESRR